MFKNILHYSTILNWQGSSVGPDMLGVKTLIVNLITAIRTLTNKRRRSSCIDARRRGCFDGV